MTFSNRYLTRKVIILWFEFPWSTLLRVQLIQVMAWHTLCAKPLPEPMITYFTDEWRPHQLSMSQLIVAWWHRASYTWIAPGNPTLWRGVPVASIQKSFGSSGRDWKPWKKIPIPCKFCTYRFIRYPSTCYGKVRINPLMANIRNPDFFASPVANATWFVVVWPCYLNRDLLSGPKGN